MEIKARELDSKVLLACYAAEAGFKVILGEQIGLNKNLRKLPRGIYFDKSISPHKYKKILWRAGLGNQFVCLDEEGIFTPNENWWYRERVSPQTMELTEAYLVWGKAQEQILKRKLPEATDRVTITGGQRADLWRPELRPYYDDGKRRLEETFGDFILVATNFSLCLHPSGEEWFIKYMTKNGTIRSAAEEEFYRDYIDYTKGTFREFVRAINHISTTFPETKIIIRPHPGEDIEVWTEIYKEYKNVRVLREGGVTPWILAAKALIHNSCTTGFEAYLLDIPVISYMPQTSEDYDLKLPNELSEKTYTIQELDCALEKVLEGRHKVSEDEAEKRRQMARHHIDSLDGKFASERIVAVLRAMPQREKWPTREQRQIVRSRQVIDMKRNLSRSMPLLMRSMLGGERQQRWARDTPECHAWKFPRTEKEEIQKTVKRYSKILNRFDSTTVKNISNNIFCLEKEST